MPLPPLSSIGRLFRSGAGNVAEAAGSAARGIGAVVGKAPPSPVAFSRGFKANLIDQLKTQAGTGAVMGGVLGGGLGALTADPEHRGEGALRGAAGGALAGAVGGAVTAPVTAAARTGRLRALDKMLPAEVAHEFAPWGTLIPQGVKANTGEAAANAIHAATPWKNLKDAWGHRGTAFGRANAMEFAAVPAVFGAEYYLGNKVLEHLPSSMGGMGPAPQQAQAPQQGAYVGPVPPQPGVGPVPQKMAAEAPPPDEIPTQLGTQLGGLSGALTGEALGRYLEAHHALPEKHFSRFALPAVLGTAGTLAGFYTIKGMNEARRAE